MTPKSNILCIFEGESREVKYFRTVQNIYFGEQSILVCSFGNDIFELYKKIQEDEDLDIVELLRESKDVPSNEEALDGYSRDDFNQVFLFFDFECQDQSFDQNAISLMIELFNEETENGKIFISYPMIEAIRDIPSFESYMHHKVLLENCRGKIYKRLSADGLNIFNDPRHNDKADWDKLVEINVEKANFLITGEKGILEIIPEQSNIAVKQCESMVDSESIYVLSSYPLFVFHQKASIFSFQNKT